VEYIVKGDIIYWNKSKLGSGPLVGFGFRSMILVDVTVLSKTFFNERSARIFFLQVDIERDGHPLYRGDDCGAVFALAAGCHEQIVKACSKHMLPGVA
jgi:hypothetical protein